MMKHYFLFFVIGINMMYVQSTFAFNLVTETEVTESENAPWTIDVAGSSTDGKGPEIIVLNPDSANKSVKNPFTVEVIFKSIEGSSIDISSFKAFYGSLNIDITDRLLKESKMTASGFKLNNINVPNGNHKITLLVKDSKSRQCEKVLRFKIE